MGQTIAEKILSRKNLAGESVKAGDVIEAAIDGIMIGRGLSTIDDTVKEGGLPEGIPELWDKDKMYVVVEHLQPPSNAQLARRNQRTRATAKRLGVTHFHDAVPGIHHQIMFDSGYVRPGELLVATDSHTPIYGALNVAGVSVGQPDLAYAMTFGKQWFRVPTTIKVVLKGRLPKYPIAKDIALFIAATYGDDVAQGRAIEYTGPIAEAMSLDSRMSLSASSTELGAMFALFEADKKTLDYIRARTDLPFEPASPDPDARYERIIEVDVDKLPFYVAKPHLFKNGVPVSETLGVKIDVAAIGACVNGRMEDIIIAARILKGRKVHPDVRFIVQPASYGIAKQCMDTGLFQDLIDAGAQPLAPGCHVCHAHAPYLADGEVCIAATPRNYKGRLGSTEAFVYLADPATVAASAIAGEIVDPTEVLHEIGLI